MRFVAVFGLAGAVGVGACAGSSENAPPAPPQTFGQLTLEIFGGFGPEPCSNAKDHYEVTTASSLLSWKACDYTKTPSQPIAGERPLTESELRSVNEAYRGVAISNAKSCGADAAILTLDVETDRGVTRYVDDFYSGCPSEAHAGRTFVTGLGHLGNVLSELAHTE